MWFVGDDRAFNSSSWAADYDNEYFDLIECSAD